MSEPRKCRRGHIKEGDNVVRRVYRGMQSDRCRQCERERSQLTHRRVADRRGDECDCGQPKKRDAEACDSCSFLDGKLTSPTQGLVIAALRMMEELSITDLVNVVYGGKRTSYRTVYRTLGDMIAAGRVQRRYVESEPFQRPTRLNGAEFIAPGANAGRYVYRLTAPARGEIGRAA